MIYKDFMIFIPREPLHHKQTDDINFADLYHKRKFRLHKSL